MRVFDKSFDIEDKSFDISVERCICTFDNSESYFAWYKECAQSTDNLPLEGSHRNNFLWSMT